MIEPSNKLQVEKPLTRPGIVTIGVNSLHRQDHIFSLCVHLKIYVV